MDNVPAFFTDSYPKIMNKMAQKGQTMTGMPCGFYYTWDPEKNMTDMAAAMSYTERGDMGSSTKVNIGPGEADVYSSAIVYDYYGGYEGAVVAHEALGKWAETNEKKLVMPVVEEYMNDPTTVAPEEVQTRIYYFFE